MHRQGRSTVHGYSAPGSHESGAYSRHEGSCAQSEDDNSWICKPVHAQLCDFIDGHATAAGAGARIARGDMSARSCQRRGQGAFPGGEARLGVMTSSPIDGSRAVWDLQPRTIQGKGTSTQWHQCLNSRLSTKISQPAFRSRPAGSSSTPQPCLCDIAMFSPPQRHPRCSRIFHEMPIFPMLDRDGQRPVPTTSSAVDAPSHPRIPTDYCPLSCSLRNQRHSLLSLTRCAWKSGLGGNPRYTNVEEAKYGCSRRLCVARLGKQPDRPLAGAESPPFGLVRSLSSWFRVPVATHCTSR
jgi:hypothetical protein